MAEGLKHVVKHFQHQENNGTNSDTSKRGEKDSPGGSMRRQRTGEHRGGVRTGNQNGRNTYRKCTARLQTETGSSSKATESI